MLSTRITMTPKSKRGGIIKTKKKKESQVANFFVERETFLPVGSRTSFL